MRHPLPVFTPETVLESVIDESGSLDLPPARVVRIQERVVALRVAIELVDERCAKTRSRMA